MPSSGFCALVAFVTALVIAPPAALASPLAVKSSGCSATGEVAAVLCADPARERAITTLLPAARTAILPRGPSAEDMLQSQWRKDRQACATQTDVRACVANVDDYRAYDLAVAALFSDHRAAMPEIERHSSKAAEIYEAIYRYATIADRPARTSAVALRSRLPSRR